MRSRRFALLLLGPLLSLAPLGGCDHHTPPPDIPDNDNFEDFTAPEITSLAQLRQMAAAPPGDEIGAAIFGTNGRGFDCSTRNRFRAWMP